MYYIEFCAGQCKKRFTAYLSTASIHNYCSRKHANKFQRILNIVPETIPPYQIKEGTGKSFDIKEKIDVPVTVYFSNTKQAKLKILFHIASIMEKITLGNDFIFDGPKSVLKDTSLTFNDGCSVKLKSPT